MELVYLWVKKYKNIKETGFNFSSKFDCEYKNCFLKIDTGKNDIKNFFNENGLTNITAIVGKNGTGKSSIFELLSAIIPKIKTLIDADFIIIFNEDDEIFTYTHNIDIKTSTYLKGPINIIDYEEYDSNFSIYYSNDFNNGILNQTIDNFSSPQYKTYNEKEKLFNQSILNLYVNSNRIIEEYSADSIYMNKHGLRIDQLNLAYNNAKIFTELNFLKAWGEDFLPFKVPNILFISIAYNRNIKGSGYQEDPYVKIEKAILDYKSSQDLEKRIQASDEDEDIVFELTQNEKDLIALLKESILKDDRFMLSIENASNFMDLYKKIGITLFDFSWNNLSSGEDSIFQFFALLFPAILASIDDKNTKSNIFINIDEIENNLHPQWQKEFIFILLRFLNQIQYVQYHDNKRFINFQVLISTHSPFILSDIPQQNIVFLDKYKINDKEVENSVQEVGNCKVVDGLQTNEKTFGANIHSLLSDSFFMETSLMGDFAKNKINKIMQILNTENYQANAEEKKKLYFTIDAIGEDFLRTKLLDMYYKKFTDEKLKRIKELDEELTRLSK